MMKIIKENIDINAEHTPSVATIGFFDGVHTGHLCLLNQLRQTASDTGLTPAVITFSNHPQFVLNPKFKLNLLTSTDEKLELLEKAGVETCSLFDFTQDFSYIDAEKFIKDFLYNRLNVRHLIVGYDHRFGHNREEGFDQYVQYGKECGMTISRAVELEGKHVSSTTIRHHLASGRIEEANRLLGRNYSLSGKVVHGNHLGRTIGFPTANLSPLCPEKITPENGIYEAFATVDGQRFHGMAYIGARPTVVQHGEKSIEVNIFDFDRDIYGETLTVEFCRYIRADRKFDSIESLRKQLEKDREKIY